MRASQWMQALGLQLPWRQRLQDNDRQAGTRIAIIGAGIAASSLVNSLSTAQNKSVHITIFEREGVVGGRILSKPHPLGYHGALEHGAAFLATDDNCVIDLAHRAGLEHGLEAHSGLNFGGSGGFPFRFGTTTRTLCDLDTQDWRQVLDLNWAYGLSFWRVRRLVQSLTSAWTTHTSKHSPLSDFQDLSLFKSAAQYFSKKWINRKLTRDVLNACTKSRTYRRTDESSALSSSLAIRSTTRTGIVGGNQQVVQSLLSRSGGELLLNTTVLRIGRGKHRAYSVQYISQEHQTKRHAEFDIILLTAPLGTNQIHFDLPEQEVIQKAAIAYEARHVTYVVTPQDMSYTAQYNYLDVIQKSDNVLTAGQISDVNIDTVDSRTRWGEIKCRSGDELECDQFELERIYRITSRQELSDWDVVNMIRPYIGSDRAEGRPVNISGAMHDSRISFISRHAWPHAFPSFTNNGQKIVDVELAPNLFYTAAFEHIVSSMEMSCRAGQYVAAKVKDVLTVR